MVSEWRSVIAVSLNVGGGVRLIKPAKLCMCTQILQTQRGRTHSAGCVRQWFRTAELLGERRYEDWNTYTKIFFVLISFPEFLFQFLFCYILERKDKKWFKCDINVWISFLILFVSISFLVNIGKEMSLPRFRTIALTCM